VHVAHTEDIRNVYNNLVGKLEGKRPFGRPIRRWEDHRDVRGGCGLEVPASGRDQWRALVNTVMIFWIPEKAGNFLTSQKGPMSM
jgi:hypothetical protein